MLTIIVEDNGDYIRRKKTLSSLEKQSSSEYRLSFCSKENRKAVICHLKKEKDEYYFFVNAGYELFPDAVETVNRCIRKTHERWYYGDERIWGNTAKGYEVKAKPEFGVFGFVSCLYTGAAVIFSGTVLDHFCHNVLPVDYDIFLLKMTIDAAVFCDGCHIEKLLLQRTDVYCIPEKYEESVNQWINELLYARHFPVVAAADRKEKICRLYRMDLAQKTSSILVISEDPAKKMYWKNMYEDPMGGRQVVITEKGRTMGETWNRGVEQAQGELLFFVRAGCQMPAEYKMRELEAFVAVDGIGTVSPRLIGYDGKVLYTGAARTGEGFCSPLVYDDPEWNGYVKGIREISVTSCYFFAVSKELWRKAGGFSEADISPDFCLADFCLRLEQMGYVNLYHGQTAVYLNEQNRKERQTGLLYMLRQWDRQWAGDPYFTGTMCRKVLESEKKYTQFLMPDRQTETADQKKTILIISHELSMTGAPLAVFYASCILKREGYRLLIVGPQDGVLKEKFLENEIPVLIDERICREDSWLSYAEEFDLVLVNTVVPFMCVEYLEKIKMPVIWWIHDAKEGYEAEMRNVLPDRQGKMTEIYCVSEYARNVLLRFRPKYSAQIMLYGLPDMSDTASEGNEWNGPEDEQERTVFLIVGTLEPRKGQDILLDAIEKMDEKNRTKCKFYFIGGVKRTGILNKLKEDMRRYPDEIRWIPFLDRKEMMKAYAGAEAVICCSRDDPMPVTMAEAMMMSKICICSENTGTASLIENGKNGFVYRRNSSEELLDIILYVLSHRQNMNHICEEARKTYEEKFAMPVFKQKLLSVVENI